MASYTVTLVVNINDYIISRMRTPYSAASLTRGGKVVCARPNATTTQAQQTDHLLKLSFHFKNKALCSHESYFTIKYIIILYRPTFYIVLVVSPTANLFVNLKGISMHLRRK